jgi:hypothetical protein
MVIHDADRAVARSMFEVAVGMVAAREEIHIAEYAHDALRNPCAATIRALLSRGRGEPWLASVVDAVAQVGIAAAEDVLSDDLTHEGFVAATRPVDRRPWAEIGGRMRGGITIHDVNALALGEDWWDVISGWVDEQRGLK